MRSVAACAVAFALCSFAHSAIAASISNPITAPGPASEIERIIPSAVSGVMPGDPGTAPKPGYFPELPPSRPCTKQNLIGVWQLYQLYENPTGSETTNFAAQPYQFLLFDLDDTYKETRSSIAVNAAAGIAGIKNLQLDTLQQYLVNDTGIIYFYKDSIATDNLACFIVANPTGQFMPGQMLLMPPIGQSTSRVARVYRQLTKNASNAPTRAEAIREIRQRRAELQRQLEQRRMPKMKRAVKKKAPQRRVQQAQ